MANLNTPANVAEVHTFIDLAFPVRAGTIGAYPFIIGRALELGHTVMEIANDMNEALANLPAGNPGDISFDGGSTYKRRIFCLGESPGADLFDPYYEVGPPEYPKPTAKQIYDRIFGTGATEPTQPPVVQPPIIQPPVVQPPDAGLLGALQAQVKVLGDRLYTVEAKLDAIRKILAG